MNRRRQQIKVVGIPLVFAVVAIISTTAAVRYQTAAVRTRQALATLETENHRLLGELRAIREATPADVGTPPVLDEPVSALTADETATDADRVAAELARRDAEIEALRARLAELRMAVAERPAAEPETPENRMQQGWQRLRERDPERFARRVEETRERIVDLADLTQDRLAYMLEVP